MSSKENILPAERPVWMQSSMPGDSIIAASSITVSRNIEGFIFPPCGRSGELKAVRDFICGVFRRGGILGRRRRYFEGGAVDAVTAGMLRELEITEGLDKPEADGRGVFLNADQDTAAVINDGEHLRMKFFASGFRLKSLWRRANLMDSRLAGRMEYAFDPELGYLTSSPDTLGTGLCVKVLLHLPVLEFTGALDQVLSAMLPLGIGVTGKGGEGCGRCGSMYVFSNMGTLGESEAEIITRVSAVTEKVRSQERHMRLEMLKKDKLTLLDKVSRSYGLLRHCYLLPGDECLAALSWLRLGIDLGMFRHLDMETVDDIALFAGNASLSRFAGKDDILSRIDRAACRADMARERMAKCREDID